jgi:pentatricopeptide repeat protein
MIIYAYVEEGRFPEAVQVIDRWKQDKSAPRGLGDERLYLRPLGQAERNAAGVA